MFYVGRNSTGVEIPHPSFEHFVMTVSDKSTIWVVEGCQEHWSQEVWVVARRAGRPGEGHQGHHLQWEAWLDLHLAGVEPLRRRSQAFSIEDRGFLQLPPVMGNFRAKNLSNLSRELLPPPLLLTRQ